MYDTAQVHFRDNDRLFKIDFFPLLFGWGGGHSIAVRLIVIAAHWDLCQAENSLSDSWLCCVLNYPFFLFISLLNFTLHWVPPQHAAQGKNLHLVCWGVHRVPFALKPPPPPSHRSLLFTRLCLTLFIPLPMLLPGCVTHCTLRLSSNLAFLFHSERFLSLSPSLSISPPTLTIYFPQ